MPKTKHPMQPLYVDKHKVIRFKPNKIIEHLFSTRALDLNALACMDFPKEDRMQIAQLLGYSVSGFGDLSYASLRVVMEADEEAAKLAKRRKL